VLYGKHQRYDSDRPKKGKKNPSSFHALDASSDLITKWNHTLFCDCTQKITLEAKVGLHYQVLVI
jgi:hypothetical protein